MPRRRRRLQNEHGITLIELMIAVAIVAILATMATVGYTKYIKSARIVEAREMVGRIQMSQEAYFMRAGSYCNATGSTYSSTSEGWYPASTTGFDAQNWGTPTGILWPTCLRRARPEDGQTRFIYSVHAGWNTNRYAQAAATDLGIPAYDSTTRNVQAWYYVIARGDVNGDGTNDLDLRVSNFRSKVWTKETNP